jgi:hypothetical protein
MRLHFLAALQNFSPKETIEMCGKLWIRPWNAVAACLAFVGASACGTKIQDKRSTEPNEAAQTAELAQSNVAAGPTESQDEVYGIVADQITPSTIRLRWRSDVPSRYIEGFRIVYKVVESSNSGAGITALQCSAPTNGNTSTVAQIRTTL